MPPVSGQLIAVVDFGTNSTRLLVAEVERGRPVDLARRTEVTRLGEGVDATGRLSEAAMSRVHEALGDYLRIVEEHGSARIVGIATSAVRDAANGERFRQDLRQRFGLEVRTISGAEEARLTFRGATAGRNASAETLVLDIGGGSTEYVVGWPGSEPAFHVSTQMGSVRHTERHLASDPPAPEEMARLREDIGRAVAAAVPEAVRDTTSSGIAVAGTATSLAAIDQRLDPYDPARVHGYPLRRDAGERILSMLAGLPIGERRRVTGLHPDRAPTIVAGVAILLESMRAFGLEAMEASEADILHGAALAEVEGAGENGLRALGEAG